MEGLKIIYLNSEMVDFVQGDKKHKMSPSRAIKEAEQTLELIRPKSTYNTHMCY